MMMLTQGPPAWKGSPPRRRCLALGLALGSSLAFAADGPGPWRFGIQAGLAFPVGNDLRVTTGSGLNPSFGLNWTWDSGECHALRSRLDSWTLSPGHQTVERPQVQQIETRVQGLALGEAYEFRPKGRYGRWAVGGELYLIRWSVASTNELTVPLQGMAQDRGTSHWIREGLGLVVSCRLSSQLDAEAHWLSSHYGYENLPAYLSTVELLWRF